MIGCIFLMLHLFCE